MKVLIRTFGCQMNQYDSEQVGRLLAERGYELAREEADTDIIIFNSCSVRKHAEERVFGRLRNLARLKKKKPNLLIGVMGCMVNAYKGDLLKDFPQLDFVSGTYDFARIPEILDTMQSERGQKEFISDHHGGFAYSHYLGDAVKIRAFVPIMRGCDNFCSYCIVPYVRGREISRDPDEVIDEVSFLADNGVRDVILLGQNVNSYGKSLDINIDFSDLLEAVSKLRGVEVIRFMTSHPKDISSKLFTVMARNEKVEKHLHLPLQSGSDKILNAMNRKYTLTDYKRKVAALREYIPLVSVTTDIIVGFCGEDKADYDATKAAISEIKFDSAFIFKYSPRKHTPAFTLEDDVPMVVKVARNNELLYLQQQISAQSNLRYIDKVEKVLVESRSKKDVTQLKGRTWSDKEVIFAGDPHLIGQVVFVKLLYIVSETFIGRLEKQG